MKPRVELEPAYVLHTRHYRETSLLLDCFTRDHGKISLIAKGARRLKSPQKGLLRPFLPLLISYVGRSELKTLTSCELSGSLLNLSGERLACAFYINELLSRLLHPHMAFPEMFLFYGEVLSITATEDNYTQALRLFEKNLLQVLGYELMLQQDKHGEPIQKDKEYLFFPEQGAIEMTSAIIANGSIIVSGETLLALANDNLKEAKHNFQAKIILQAALRRLLGHKPIQSKFLLHTPMEV